MQIDCQYQAAGTTITLNCPEQLAQASWLSDWMHIAWVTVAIVVALFIILRSIHIADQWDRAYSEQSDSQYLRNAREGLE